MPDPRDPLRSLFLEAASAAQPRTGLAPIAVITLRGERARRRRITGIALACCLLFGGSAAALTALLPGDLRPVLPATPPSPSLPSPVPTSSAFPTAPPGTPTQSASPDASTTRSPQP